MSSPSYFLSYQPLNHEYETKFALEQQPLPAMKRKHPGDTDFNHELSNKTQTCVQDSFKNTMAIYQPNYFEQTIVSESPDLFPLPTQAKISFASDINLYDPPDVYTSSQDHVKHGVEDTSQHHVPRPSTRKRVSKACAACRQLKSRCDDKRPSCSNCHSSSRDCSFASDTNIEIVNERIGEKLDQICKENAQVKKKIKMMVEKQDKITAMLGELCEVIQMGKFGQAMRG